MGDEVDKIWQKLNLKEDQEIGLTEWLTMAIDRETLCTQENMEKAFNYFDTDQGGSITPDELKEKLRIQEGGSDAQIWKEIIDEVDQNGDKEIDMNEFCQMMKTIITQKTS